ncbi:Rieske (2Fe-2S) protein [Pseudomonas sp. NPDC088429]|uniref:Rieske (2Fe-2S) protein n=1 Tax=Pseudomonas sp. NPDC088429 TaxID=3364455 RepID=UPI003809DF35
MSRLPALRVAVPDNKCPPRGGRSLFEFADKSLALFNVDGELLAIDDSCPHQGASLCGGRLEGQVIQCCAHGLRFDLRSGYLLNSKQVKVTRYPVEVIDGQAFIVLASEESMA